MKPTVEEMKRQIEELEKWNSNLIERLPFTLPALVCRCRQIRDICLDWLNRNVLIVPVGIYLLYQTIREEIRPLKQQKEE